MSLKGDSTYQYLHSEQRQSECRYNFARSKLLHDRPFARHVDGAGHVEGDVEEADLEADEQLPLAGPILRILRTFVR